MDSLRVSHALWLPGGFSKWEVPAGELEGGRRVKLSPFLLFPLCLAPQVDCAPLLKPHCLSGSPLHTGPDWIPVTAPPSLLVS